MAKDKAFQIFQGLPNWAKGVIAVGGLAIVYFTGRSLWKKIKSNQDLKKARETLAKQTQELKQQLNLGVKPSFADSQYKAWADKIKNQYDGIDWKQNLVDKDVPLIGMWSGSGKVTKDIISSLKNNVDFLKLNEAYGVRTYDEAGPFTGSFTGNLTQAVNDELDRGEIMALNSILSKKGITYQF